MKKSNFKEILKMKGVNDENRESIDLKDKSDFEKRTLNSFKSQPNFNKEINLIPNKLIKNKSEHLIIPQIQS